MAEVETMFGEAPRSYFEEDGEDSFHVLGYPDVGATLFFNQEHGFRLSSDGGTSTQTEAIGLTPTDTWKQKREDFSCSARPTHRPVDIRL